jgi:hypothetical protein
MIFRENEYLMHLKKTAEMTRIFWNLSKGQGLSYFEHLFINRLEAEDSELPDNDMIELVLRYIGLNYIHERYTRAKELYEATKGFIYVP